VVLTFGVRRPPAAGGGARSVASRGYLSGLAALRTVVGVAGIGVTSAILWATGARETTVFLFVLLATSQVFVVLNNSYAAYEHAAGDVRWIARRQPRHEGALGRRGRRRPVDEAGGRSRGARGRADRGRTVRLADGARRAAPPPGAAAGRFVFAGGAMLASLPFFVNTVAHSLYARIGTGWLGAVSSAAEVGLFGAASGLASIALLGMPLISWVLIPSPPGRRRGPQAR